MLLKIARCRLIPFGKDFDDDDGGGGAGVGGGMMIGDDGSYGVCCFTCKAIFVS